MKGGGQINTSSGEQVDKKNTNQRDRKIGMNEITRIPFHENEIVVIEKDGKKFVAMTPIVKAIGLDWPSQKRNIDKDPVLCSVKVVMTSTGADGKKYDMVCPPMEYLNGWLFKVPASRYRGRRS